MTNKTLDILFTGRVIDFRITKSLQKQFPEKYKGKIFRGLVIKTRGTYFTSGESHESVMIKTIVSDEIEILRFDKINLNTIEIVSDAESILFKLEYEGKI